jgi:hypothetical protein
MAASNKSGVDQVSELSTNRLLVYLRGLTLEASGVRTISSQALAVSLNAAQIRKDLPLVDQLSLLIRCDRNSEHAKGPGDWVDLLDSSLQHRDLRT